MWSRPQRMSLVHPPGFIVGRHVSRSLLRGESALPHNGERRRCRNVTGNLHDKWLGHRAAPAGGLGRARGDGGPDGSHQSLGFPSATPSASGGGGWGRRVPNHDPVGQIPRPTLHPTAVPRQWKSQWRPLGATPAACRCLVTRGHEPLRSMPTKGDARRGGGRTGSRDAIRDEQEPPPEDP